MASATTVDPAGDGDDDFEDDEKQRGRCTVVEDDPDDNDYVPGISTQEDESEDEPDDEEAGDGEDEEDGNDEGVEEEEEEDEGEEEEEENVQADRTADWPDKCTDCGQFFVGIGVRNGRASPRIKVPHFHFHCRLFHPIPDFLIRIPFCFSNPGGYFYYFSALGKSSASLRCRETKGTVGLRKWGSVVSFTSGTPTKDAVGRGRLGKKQDTRCSRVCHSLGEVKMHRHPA